MKRAEYDEMIGRARTVCEGLELALRVETQVILSHGIQNVVVGDREREARHRFLTPSGWNARPADVRVACAREFVRARREGGVWTGHYDLDHARAHTASWGDVLEDVLGDQTVGQGAVFQ